MSAKQRALAGLAVLVIAVIAVVAIAVGRDDPKKPSASPPGTPSASGPPSTTATTGALSAGNTAVPGQPSATTTSTTAAAGAVRPRGRDGGPFANGTPATLAAPVGAPLDPLPPPDPGWRVLSAGSSGGTATFGVFHISGATTQIRFRSSAGQFRLYVVDQQQGREATAGYPDVECAGPCNDQQGTTLAAGDYHIETEGDGPSEFSFEQYAP
ncbi:MAG: hypothetical protein NVSMB16_12690 [Acidimicrobiales bacterium]